MVSLPGQYFGEGIVDWKAFIYQWTWKSGVCFVYDRSTLKRVKTLGYEGEGWGMTRMGDRLITSDGSATLTFRDPTSLKPLRAIRVHDGVTEVGSLNELEFIKGKIFANVWHSNTIAIISAQDGRVEAWVDLTGILPGVFKLDEEAVLNGIAYDAISDRIFVTGKDWPMLFEIKIRDMK